MEKFTKNEITNNVSFYVEKILEQERKNISQVTNKNQPLTLGIWLWVGVGILVICLIIFILVSMLICLHERTNKAQNILTNEELREFRYGTSDKYVIVDDKDDNLVCGKAIRKPYNQNLEILEDMLEIYWTSILGTGEFGCVFRALWKCAPPKEIALKTTKNNCSAHALRGILSEIKILSHLGQHPNIVSICGAYTAEIAIGKVYLATELCTMGSLKKHFDHICMDLRENALYGNVMILQENLLRWSFEIASGMEHLEKMGVIHADLATRNVLLTSEYTAKISDFGLARRLCDYSNYLKQQQEPLPWRWMSIESLKLMLFSHESDVWSYGITLWEIFSVGVQPYPGLSWSVDFVNLLEGGLRMTRPRFATSELYEIMVDCWHSRPDRRPTFAALKQKIDEIFNSHKYVNVRN